jgi:GNAT superfamily N-acetyltransferase
LATQQSAKVNEHDDENQTLAVQIREAPLERVLDLRWSILRAGLPREAANFEGDDEPTTKHFIAVSGAREQEVVTACATFVRRPWNGQPAWQLRGMAVQKEHQRSGIGRRLLDFAERALAQEGHSRLLWCNARTPAVPFYQRAGWAPVGEEFFIETAGPHYRMTKRLERKGATNDTNEHE